MGETAAFSVLMGVTEEAEAEAAAAEAAAIED